VQGQTGGNPNVGPEKSDTITLGATYTPHAIRNLAISIDAYKVRINGAIAPLALNATNILNLCYYTTQDANSPFCRAVHRDPSTGEMNGQSNYFLDQTNFNTGGIRVSGIDFNATYSKRIKFAPLGGVSRLSMNAAVGYTDSYVLIPVQAMPNLQNQCAGKFGPVCGYPTPKWKGVMSLTWETGPVSLTLRNRVTGSVERDIQTDTTQNHVPAYDYVDLSVSVELPSQIKLYGSITNIADTWPPILGSGATSFGLGTSPGAYEVYGRSFVLGVTKKF